MTFENPSRKIKIDKCGDVFDTSIGITENNIPEEPNALTELSHSEQTHAFALYSAGHKIAFDKCYFYLVDFERDGFEHRHKTLDELPERLHLR